MTKMIKEERTRHFVTDVLITDHLLCRVKQSELRFTDLSRLVLESELRRKTLKTLGLSNKTLSLTEEPKMEPIPSGIFPNTSNPNFFQPCFDSSSLFYDTTVTCSIQTREKVPYP